MSKRIVDPARVTYLQKEPIVTKKGTLDVIKMRLDYYPSDKDRKALSKRGWNYYGAKFQIDETSKSKTYTEAGYWGHKYDSKLYEAMAKEVSSAKSTAKPTAKKPTADELVFKETGYSLDDLCRMAGIR